MKNSRPPARRISILSQSLQKQMNMYVLAGSAAGVSALALAQPAGAKIVYTPAHRQLSPQHRLDIDLNNDGIVDFGIADFFSCCTDTRGTLVVGGYRTRNGLQNLIVVSKNTMLDAALRKGEVIGPKRSFGVPFYSVMETCFGYKGRVQQHGGYWLNVRDRYLGFKFFIKGQVHYGWARLSTTHHGCFMTGTLTGYAYETIPNKPIVAGQTQGHKEAGQSQLKTRGTSTPELASLGLLSRGAPGLAAWRRRNTAEYV